MGVGREASERGGREGESSEEGGRPGALPGAGHAGDPWSRRGGIMDPSFGDFPTSGVGRAPSNACLISSSGMRASRCALRTPPRSRALLLGLGLRAVPVLSRCPPRMTPDVGRPAQRGEPVATIPAPLSPHHESAEETRRAIALSNNNGGRRVGPRSLDMSRAHGDHGHARDVPRTDLDYTFEKGSFMRIKIVDPNATAHPVQHPIHIHGQRFVRLDG